MASRGAVTQTVAAAISGLVVLVIIVAGFVPIAAVARTSVNTYTTSEVFSTPYVNTYTSIQTATISTTGHSQPYGFSDFTLNCNTWTWQTATLYAGWNIQVTYSAGDTITVYLFNSNEFRNFNSTGSTTSEASQTGMSSGTFGYNVPLADSYYLVFDNNLHNGFFCVGGEKVTITSVVGTASYPTTTTTTTVVTAYSTSTSYSTSTYTTSSTTTSTKSVGWLCYIFGC